MVTTDRVILGENGMQVSKPGVNAQAFSGNTYLSSLANWYAYHEEFDFSDFLSGSSLQTNDFADSFGSDFTTNVAGVAFGGPPRIARTSNGTLLFAPSNANNALETPKLVGTDGIPNSDRSIMGEHYPIVEMRIRKTTYHADVGASEPPASGHDFKLWWDVTTIDGSHTHPYWDPDTVSTDSDLCAFVTSVDGVAEPSANYYRDYTNIFTDNEYKILEWDLSEKSGWVEAATTAGAKPGGGYLSAAYRITRLAIAPTMLATGGQYPHGGSKPLYEIDYIRVKKPEIPRNFSPYESAADSMFFDTASKHYGSVVQSGVVQIGTGRAKIDGKAEVWEGTSSSGKGTYGAPLGHVDFPPLPYVPVVLFQRYDPNSNTVYPSGEKEFSFLSVTAHGVIPSTELRTFAYVRASNSYFEITCRGALARDGLEWRFNYANQFPPSANQVAPYTAPSDGKANGIYFSANNRDKSFGTAFRGDSFRNLRSNTALNSKYRYPALSGVFKHDRADWGIFPFSRLLHQPDWIDSDEITNLGNDPSGRSYRSYFINDKHWMGLPWVPNGFTKRDVYDVTTQRKASTRSDYREFRGRDHGPRGIGHDAESTINLASVGITSGPIAGISEGSTDWEMWERSKIAMHPYAIPDPSYLHGHIHTMDKSISDEFTMSGRGLWHTQDVRAEMGGRDSRSQEFVKYGTSQVGALLRWQDRDVAHEPGISMLDGSGGGGLHSSMQPPDTFNWYYDAPFLGNMDGDNSATGTAPHGIPLVTAEGRYPNKDWNHWMLGGSISTLVGGMANSSFYVRDIYIPGYWDLYHPDQRDSGEGIGAPRTGVKGFDSAYVSANPEEHFDTLVAESYTHNSNSSSLDEIHLNSHAALQDLGHFYMHLKDNRLAQDISVSNQEWYVATPQYLAGSKSQAVQAMHEDLPPELWMQSFADGAVTKWNTSYLDPEYSRFNITHDIKFRDKLNAAGAGGADDWAPPAGIDSSVPMELLTQKIGANTSGICHPYGVVPRDGTKNTDGLVEPGVTIDGETVSTYFANYSVTNNQSTYIGGAPYKNVIRYDGEGNPLSTSAQQIEPSISDYNHDGAPLYKYYVLRIPASYVPGEADETGI